MSALKRIEIMAREDGRFDMFREFTETGDRWVCDDLHEAFDILLGGFRPDGTARPPRADRDPVEAFDEWWKALKQRRATRVRSEGKS